MKNLYKTINRSIAFRVSLIVGIILFAGGNTFAQTNNYFGTSGTLSGSAWSTSVGGPYTSALNTTGGAIINFGNTTTSITGGTISVAAINATANATITTNSGTLGNAINIVPITVSSGITLDLAGQAMSGSATAGYTKSGAGVLGLTGNTYAGGFTLTTGTVIIKGINALGAGGSNILTLNGGVIAANGTMNLTGKYPGGITIGGNIQFGEITSNVALASNTGNMTFSNAIALGSTTRTFTLGNAGTHTFNSVISGTGGIVYTANANGTGVFTILGTNTYTGPTSINGCNVSISSVTNGGVSGSLGASTNPATNLIFGGGTLTFTSTGTTDRNFTLTNGTTSIINVSGSALTLTGAAVGSSGALTKSGTGTLEFDGSNLYTGATTITAGTLKIGAAERINDNSALSMSAGTLDLNGFSETVGSVTGAAGSITSFSGGTPLFTAGGDNSSTTFAGIISNGPGTVAFTKTGTGTLNLTGSNTYTGATTVSGGTLQLNKSGGALASAQSVSVSSGGTLKVSQNQTLTNLTLASGSTLTVDPGTTLTITGTLTVNVGATVNGTGSVAYTGGTLLYTGSGAITSGIEWPSTSNIVNINSGVTVTLGSSKTTLTTLTVDGTLKTIALQISGSGTMNINGTLVTENLFGLIGTNTTFNGTSPTLNLGASSTIEYAAPSGTQIITTSPSYVNLTLSSGGTKSTASALAVSGTLTVSGATYFDASGTATVGGSGTNVTMTGTSRYSQGGTGQEPRATGTYSLSAGTTIIFAGNGPSTQQDIKLTGVTYANVEISGTNVGLSGPTSIIPMQSGTTFTVKTGGTFNVQSTSGFSGSSSTAVNTTPTIVLETGSTINYNGTSNQPITNAMAYQNLKISAGTGITETAPSGTLSILGDLSKTGTATFAHNNGIVSIDGTTATTQTYTAVDNMDFFNLVNNNTNGGFTVNGSLGVQKLLTLSTVSGSASKLIFGASGIINIRSTSATGTAAIDQMSSSVAAAIDYSGGGRFRIERYVNYVKKWQMLSIPTTESGGKTVRSQWMEASVAANDNLSPGYGMQITDPSSTGGGFDAISFGPSVKKFNPGSYNYSGISSPSATINTAAGYMAFVRGDRLSLSTNGTNNPTVLRTTGKIQDGNNVTVSDAAATTGNFQIVGNPYASAIDLRLISFSNLTTASSKPEVYVWDPTIAGTNGVGKFIVLSYNGSNYISNNNMGLYNNTAGATSNYIQSGQAFMVLSLGGTGSVTFHDADKVASSTDVAFTAGNLQMFRTNMYSLNDGVHPNSADGAVVLFDDHMNSSLDSEDALKMLNTSDNLSLRTGGQLIGIERRHSIEDADTLHLDISAMHAMPYRFVFTADNMDAPGRKGFLVDRFTGTQTILNITGNTQYDFTVTADAASFARDRFSIIFKQEPLPVFISTTANANPDKTIAVSWKVAHENNVNLYVVERSADGINFSSVSSSGPSQNNNPASVSYAYRDIQPLKADNYFRIKMILNTGAFIYSDIMKVNKISDAVYISVVPNPVTGKIIHLQMSNQPAGIYATELVSTSGQIVYKGTVTVSGYFETKNIELDKNTVPGIYQLRMQGAGQKETVQKILIR